jgi:hypothetical protein
MRSTSSSGASSGPTGAGQSGSNTSPFYSADLEDLSFGAGAYVVDDEFGVYGFRSFGPVDVGIGVGVSPKTKEFDVFAFLGGETEGIGPQVENFFVAGYSGNSGAYTGTITSRGSSIGLPGLHVGAWGGSETTTPAHPVDWLVNTLFELLGDSFKSILSPLSDPSSFTDPFQDSAPSLVINPRN